MGPDTIHRYIVYRFGLNFRFRIVFKLLDSRIGALGKLNVFLFLGLLDQPFLDNLFELSLTIWYK